MFVSEDRYVTHHEAPVLVKPRVAPDECSGLQHGLPGS